MQFQELRQATEWFGLACVVEDHGPDRRQQLQPGTGQVLLLFQSAVLHKVQELLLIELKGEDDEVLNRIVFRERNGCREDVGEVQEFAGGHRTRIRHHWIPAYCCHSWARSKCQLRW